MEGLSVTQIQVKGFDKNFSYLIINERTCECVLVDPCGEIERVLDEIRKKALTLIAVLITHSHFDHHEKLGVALDFSPVPVYMHKNAHGKTIATSSDERLLSDQDTITINRNSIKTFFTPGHHDDCMCYFVDEKNATDGVPKIITGDTLFVEGCGRTTEAGVVDLYASLQFLKTFPDATQVFPGHDYGSVPHSTIEREKEHNKYFLAKNIDEFRVIRLPNG